jgi:hypothetical protein
MAKRPPKPAHLSAQDWRSVDDPEATHAEFATARPFKDVFPDVYTAAKRAMNPAALYVAMHDCWSVETGGKWLSANPARGQCSVTALVVQDFLGGDILKTDVDGEWHFYNRIDGRRWDLTMRQFETPIGYDDFPSDHHEAMSDTFEGRYRLLHDRVRRALDE